MIFSGVCDSYYGRCSDQDFWIEVYKGSDLSTPAILSQHEGPLERWGFDTFLVTFDPAVSDYTLVLKGAFRPDYPYSTIAGMTLVMVPVPEPAEYAMLLAGLGVVGVVTRRRRARAAMRRLG